MVAGNDRRQASNSESRQHHDDLSGESDSEPELDAELRERGHELAPEEGTIVTTTGERVPQPDAGNPSAERSARTVEDLTGTEHDQAVVDGNSSGQGNQERR